MMNLEWRKLPQGWLAWNASKATAIAGVGASYMRPWLFPLYTPAGRQTLQEFAFDHPFHNGLFIGIHPVECAGVSHNFWATPPQRAAEDEFMNALGRIVMRGEPALASDRGVLHAKFETEWVGLNDLVVFAERRSFEIYVDEAGHHVSMESKLSALCDLHIPVTKFAGVGVRLDPRLTKTAGGRFVCQHGSGGAVVAHGKTLDKLDVVAGGSNGFALTIRSDHYKGPWFVRDYGLVLLNPATNEAIDMKAGDELRLSVSLIANDVL